MANLNGLAGQIVGQNVTRLLGELQIVADNFDNHRTVLEMLKRKEITVDDYQLIDGGGIQVMPPAPPTPDACDPTVGDSFGKIKNNRNGKNGTQPEPAEAVTYG
jgi:hypothetical protein